VCSRGRLLLAVTARNSRDHSSRAIEQQANHAILKAMEERKQAMAALAAELAAVDAGSGKGTAADAGAGAAADAGAGAAADAGAGAAADAGADIEELPLHGV